MGNMTTLQILQGVHDWVLDKIDEETANFITKTVNDLVNYYTKSETYTKAEVQQIVDAIKQFTYEVVQVLPTASASTMNKIYLVPAPKSEDKNVKEEYITIQDGSTYSWEMLGTTSIDLSNYYTKGQTDSAISSALSSALASYTTTADLTTLLAQKQDVIQDLADIRSGASAGSTAVQPSTLNNAVKNVVAESGVYDVSANNDNTKFESLSALLSSANLNTLIPTDIRKGGMSIKFVLSSDNNYVQFRYMLPYGGNTTAENNKFANPANWQGVDDEPIAGSDNLVKSGGVYAEAEKKANIDGYYETMGVGTADNLTGQTERTNDAMYRKTGGSEEVASGIAELVSVKGNTVVWNQLSVVNSKNIVILKGAAYPNTTPPTYIVSIIPTKSKKHIFYIKCKSNKDIQNYYFSSSLAQHRLGNNSFISKDTDYSNQYDTLRLYSSSALAEPIEDIITIISIDLTLIYGEGNEPTTPEEFEADYQRWFGKPLTYEPYDDGSLRPVLMNSIKTVGFNQYNPSNGLVKAIVGSQYQITGTYNSIWESDEEEVSFVSYTYGETTEIGLRYSNGNGRYMCNSNIAAYSNTSTYGVGQFVIYDGSIYKCSTAITEAEEWDASKWTLVADISAMVTEGIFSAMNITPDSNGILTPTKFYVHVEGGNATDTCVHLVGNGAMNGEYEQYKENTASIPVTTLTGKLNGEGESVVVFPDGMKRVGSVFDEIVIKNGKAVAIKRVDGIDLGNAKWNYRTSGSPSKTRFYTTAISNKVVIIDSTILPKLLNAKYLLSTPRDAYYAEVNKKLMTIAIDGFWNVNFEYGSIVIQDSTYSTNADLKTSLNGVMLYYVLKTPQEYILDNFQLPIRIQADALGTEEQIIPSGVASAPATIDIKYAIDAVGFILNAPKGYISEASMDNFLSRLGSVMGGTWSKTWNDNTGEWDFSFTPNAQTNDTNIEETI